MCAQLKEDPKMKSTNFERERERKYDLQTISQQQGYEWHSEMEVARSAPDRDSLLPSDQLYKKLSDHSRYCATEVSNREIWSGAI